MEKVTFEATLFGISMKIEAQVNTWGETPQTRDDPGEPAGWDLERLWIDGRDINLNDLTGDEGDRLDELIEAELIRMGEESLEAHADYMAECRAERWGA